MTQTNNNYSDILQWVDVPKFALACHNISQQSILNESTNRMMKEKFILGALLLCNHAKNIEWSDGVDYDLIFNSWSNGLVEVKTGNEPMFSKKTGKPKKKVKLKLKNVYESSYQREHLDKDFDYLMIVQIYGTFAIGFVDYTTVVQNLKKLTDGFLVELTHDQINIVYKQDMRSEPAEWTLDLNPRTWVLSQLASAGI